MITFLTGLPGSGKTLRAITLGIQFVEAGRPVYELGISGLNHDATGIKPFPHGGLEDWQKLEPNAVLIVDEAQQWLRPRGNGAMVPDWIEALTRNRHQGIDLLLITQDAMLVDSYVRRLGNYHEHLIRPPGDPSMARVWTFTGVQEDVAKKGARTLNAEFKLWRYPQQNYALYKSAELHTVKWRIPQSLRFVLIGCVLVLALAGVGVWAMASIGDRAPEPASALAPTAPAVVRREPKPERTFLFSGAAGRHRFETTEEYLLQQIPRIEGMPWSAPMYDGLTPTTVPEIYCISSADSCTCLSEQGTRVRLQDAICRTIAREGSYNPFRRTGGATLSAKRG